MAPEFEKSTRALRKFLKELEQQRIHFTEREWREGIDLRKSYSAHTSVGQILLEFDGREWVFSIAPPGAKYFARREDWIKCTRGYSPNGHLFAGPASITWMRGLLKEQALSIDIEALNKIVEERYYKKRHPKAWEKFIFAASILGFFLILWVAVTTQKTGIAFGVFGYACAIIIAQLARAWRNHRKSKQLGYGKRKSQDGARRFT